MSDVGDNIEKPNPGSPAAIKRGCTCAILDNAHGRGYYGQPGVFVISGDCPIHGSGESTRSLVGEIRSERPS
jgi:hypothetical protein